MMDVIVEFGGGLETLFNNQKEIKLSLVQPTSLEQLIQKLADDYVKERSELFIKDNTVRPGILVLINETDWELEEGPKYQIQPRDRILFISTLHGG